MLKQKGRFHIFTFLAYKMIEIIPEISLSVRWVQGIDIDFSFSFLIFHFEVAYWK